VWKRIHLKPTGGRIQSEELIAIKCLRPNNPGFLGGDFPYICMNNLQQLEVLVILAPSIINQ
jgi:hypothetical protein